MPIYRVDLAYEGTGFRGYARQNSVRTVQGELEAALATVLGESVETAVAGRTDAGVHARGQVVSFRGHGLDLDRVRRSLNGIVGPEIGVREIGEAEDGFHARFSAKWRRYRYSIDQGPVADPLTRHMVWHVGQSLDLDAMRAVAASLLGEHDFGSFCRTVEGKSNVRRIESIHWDEGSEGVLELWVQANSFCQQMVRSIVGFCYDVGRGFSEAESVTRVVNARSRSEVATVAPPHGLILWEVGY